MLREISAASFAGARSDNDCPPVNHKSSSSRGKSKLRYISGHSISIRLESHRFDWRRAKNEQWYLDAHFLTAVFAGSKRQRAAGKASCDVSIATTINPNVPRQPYIGLKQREEREAAYQPSLSHSRVSAESTRPRAAGKASCGVSTSTAL